jgi:hypothetical protein
LEEGDFDMYDKIRKYPVALNSLLHELWEQGQSGKKWNEIEGEKINAVTVADLVEPEDERRFIPAAIYFNPSWIEEQKSRDPPFSAWTDDLLAQVSRKDAMVTFAEKGKGKAKDGGDVDIRPIDALLGPSFHRNLFHEVSGNTFLSPILSVY